MYIFEYLYLFEVAIDFDFQHVPVRLIFFTCLKLTSEAFGQL